MKTSKLAQEFFGKQGVNFLMTLHILIYSNEEKVSVHEIVQKFIDNKIETMKQQVFLSFYLNLPRSS